MNDTQEDLMTQSYLSPEEDEKQNPQDSRSAHSREKSGRRDLPAGTVTLLFTDIEGSTHLLQQLLISARGSKDVVK